MAAGLIPIAGAIASELIPVIVDALKSNTAGQPIENVQAQAEQLAKGAAAQVAINLAEEQSESLFKSGWRPAVGWVCAAGLAASWIGVPFGFHVVPPDDLYPLLYGILGLGGYRSAEKMLPQVVGKILKGSAK